MIGQLDLFERPTADRVQPERDPVAEALNADGLMGFGCMRIPNDLTLTGYWARPSRMFQFPACYEPAHGRDDGTAVIRLRHPDLADHPVCARIRATVGFDPIWEPLDRYGRDYGENARWHHAVDLMDRSNWSALLGTRQFTDPDAIFGAIRFSLEYCSWVEGESKRQSRIHVPAAREIMIELGAEEPADRSAALLSGLGLRPHEHMVDGKKAKKPTWAPGVQARGATGAWVWIHGHEDGWFAMGASGFACLTTDGLSRRPSSERSAA